MYSEESLWQFEAGLKFSNCTRVKQAAVELLNIRQAIVLSGYCERRVDDHNVVKVLEDTILHWFQTVRCPAGFQ